MQSICIYTSNINKPVKKRPLIPKGRSIGLVRLSKLICQIYTPYILIIVVNKTRNRQAFSMFVRKYLSYNPSICRRFCGAFTDLLTEILCLIYSMDIT